MVIAALVVFGGLLIAWLLAPAEPVTVAEAGPALPEPLAEAA